MDSACQITPYYEPVRTGSELVKPTLWTVLSGAVHQYAPVPNRTTNCRSEPVHHRTIDITASHWCNAQERKNMYHTKIKIKIEYNSITNRWRNLVMSTTSQSLVLSLAATCARNYIVFWCIVHIFSCPDKGGWHSAPVEPQILAGSDFRLMHYTSHYSEVRARAERLGTRNIHTVIPLSHQ
jgi:hypothetical protein